MSGLSRILCVIDIERRKDSRRESDITRMENERSYEALEARIHDLCTRVSQLQEAWRRQAVLQEKLERAIREDHDLMVAKIAELDRMKSIERDVKTLMRYFDNASGAGRTLAVLIALVGALGAFLAYMQGWGAE